MTVLLYSWYSYADYISPARWFVVMNYLVHSVMYSYYALKVPLHDYYYYYYYDDV